MTRSAKRTATKKARRPAANGGVQLPPEGAEAPKPAEVRISQPKGRPMLTWVGKRPISHLPAFPAQHIETFAPALPETVRAALPDVGADWPTAYPKGGILFHGDNKEVLAHLLANGFRGKVKLIYIDPPFDSGADYVRKVQLRGVTGSTKLDGETYTLGEQIQYTDIWANDNYLQFMFERLLLLKELLADGGAIFLHCDSKKGHHLRCLMDEVFGREKFLNELIWSYRRWPSNTNAFQSMHDTIYYYVVEIAERHTFHRDYEAASESYMKRFGGKTQILDEETRTRKITLEDESKGMPMRDVWDISIVAGSKHERTDYPTQKPEVLVARMIEMCSNPGDIVLDAFIGSGTTAAVAQKLGRRWIGCDINKGAIQTAAKRLQAIVLGQIDSVVSEPVRLVETDEDQAAKVPPPAQLSFTVWRVNDYDLQIQHNEAVNLAAEHIGIERLRTDGYFDGTLGNKLVKIVPFNRPLTPLDLDELRRELEARPDEARPITLVCLGMELAAKAWVEDWNRHRRGKDAVNRLNVIDLRVDPQYGGFIEHKPAQARVKARRKVDQIVIEVADFISPTILARLKQQAGLLQPTITDWRSMVDCVMVDTAYDGQVFNVVLSDVPERKDELVQGSYALPAPAGRTVVAVKIVDMLGEEVLVTHEV